MKIVADLHIHSKFSRAVSRDMVLDTISEWAKKKGVQVMGTGDFTHPGWFDEIKTKLEPSEPGLFKLKDIECPQNLDIQCPSDFRTRFMLTTEISSIYSKKGRTRRVHNLIFAPSFEAVEKIINRLSWLGNLKSDGRPIIGLDSKKLLEIVLESDKQCVLIPAHAWTPWFSIFGSMSGFNSIEECFDELAPEIFAIETGLSSDPKMNWRLSSLDKISLISNSDSHSPSRIGREANVFDCQMSYDGIIGAIKSQDPEKFLYTIEFFPEEGKYHYDGHRLCGICFPPDETKKHQNLCPRCGRKLTIGVLNRVEELADLPAEDLAEAGRKRIPFKNLIPLQEIIAEVKRVGAQSKAVAVEYEKLVGKVGPELFILIDAPLEKISAASDGKIAEAVKRVREGRVKIKPGYDGEYGKISIFDEREKIEEPKKQETLF